MMPCDREFIRAHRARFEGKRVLDFGSLDVNGNLQEALDGCQEVVGLDMRAGPNVNVVADATKPLPFERESFGAIVSTGTLEHVEKPWLALKNLAALLESGGVLLLTTPFVFGIHEHPGDYFRFTPQGLRSLCQGSGLRVESVELKPIDGSQINFLVAVKP